MQKKVRIVNTNIKYKVSHNTSSPRMPSIVDWMETRKRRVEFLLSNPLKKRKLEAGTIPACRFDDSRRPRLKIFLSMEPAVGHASECTRGRRRKAKQNRKYCM